MGREANRIAGEFKLQEQSHCGNCSVHVRGLYPTRDKKPESRERKEIG